MTENVSITARTNKRTKSLVDSRIHNKVSAEFQSNSPTLQRKMKNPVINNVKVHQAKEGKASSKAIQPRNWTLEPHRIN